LAKSGAEMNEIEHNSIFILKTKYDALKLQLEAAEKVIAFYADEANWGQDLNTYSRHMDFDCILQDSDNHYSKESLCGGKLARTYLTTKTQGE
jgi:hypothetical protein